MKANLFGDRDGKGILNLASTQDTQAQSPNAQSCDAHIPICMLVPRSQKKSYPLPLSPSNHLLLIALKRPSQIHLSTYSYQRPVISLIKQSLLCTWTSFPYIVLDYGKDKLARDLNCGDLGSQKAPFSPPFPSQLLQPCCLNDLGSTHCPVLQTSMLLRRAMKAN